MSVIETKYMEQLAQATHDVLDKFNGGYPVYPKYADPGDIVFYWYFDTPVMYDMIVCGLIMLWMRWWHWQSML